MINVGLKLRLISR